MNNKKIVWIFWCNCSWKTTLVKNLIKFNENSKNIKDKDVKITLGEDCFALWRYLTNTWWIDWLRIKQIELREKIKELRKERKEEYMFFEWFMILTGTMFDLLKEINEKDKKIEIYIIFLSVSVNKMYERLFKRNKWKWDWKTMLKRNYYYEKKIKRFFNSEKYNKINKLYIDTNNLTEEEIKNNVINFINKL